MNQFAYPWAFVLLLLPFAVRFALPAVKGLHGDALKIPFLKDLEKISIKSGSLWQMGSASDEKHFSKFFWMLMIVWVLLVTAAAMGRRANQNQKREQRHFNGFGHFNLDVGKGFCISGAGH